MARFLTAALACVAAVACATATTATPSDGPAGDDAPAIDAPDDAPDDAPGVTCTNPTCDIFPQCGCGATQACDIGAGNMAACREISANGREENTCSFDNQCDRGYVCLGSPRACRRYCAADTDCAQPRGRCLISITSGGQPIPNVPKVCSSGCDPTNAAAGGCPAALKCTIGGATINGVDETFAVCAAAGAGAQGASCQSGAAGSEALCAANHQCTTTNGTTFNCRKTCLVGSNALCAGGQTCIAFNPPLTMSGVQYGVCN